MNYKNYINMNGGGSSYDQLDRYLAMGVPIEKLNIPNLSSVDDEIGDKNKSFFTMNNILLIGLIIGIIAIIFFYFIYENYKNYKKRKKNK